MSIDDIDRRQEFDRIVSTRKGKSAAGPCGVSYLPIKKCEFVRELTWQTHQRIRTDGVTPAFYGLGDRCGFDKGKGVKRPADVRIITKVSVFSRLFWDTDVHSLPCKCRVTNSSAEGPPILPSPDRGLSPPSKSSSV
eukprot:SAG31_NODE_3581_length_4100_cov_7.299675_2_plen_137_part_00